MRLLDFSKGHSKLFEAFVIWSTDGQISWFIIRLFDSEDETELEAGSPSYAATVATSTNPDSPSSSSLTGTSQASEEYIKCLFFSTSWGFPGKWRCFLQVSLRMLVWREESWSQNMSLRMDPSVWMMNRSFLRLSFQNRWRLDLHGSSNTFHFNQASRPSDGMKDADRCISSSL